MPFTRGAWPGTGRAVVALAVILGRAELADAQNDRQPETVRGTELAIAAGGATTSTHTGPIVAGVAEWQFSRWLSGEARAGWLDRGPAAQAFTADVGGVLNLMAQRSVTPIVGLGVGLYRASFDSEAARMSDFYRRRLSARPGPTATGRSFTDPAIRVTAGLDFLVGRRLSVRPEAAALMVHGDGRRETIGTVNLRVGYRFEDRPITPAR